MFRFSYIVSQIFMLNSTTGNPQCPLILTNKKTLMKKTYYLPLTETVPFGAMERIMDATVISADPVIQDPDPGDEALMQ